MGHRALGAVICALWITSCAQGTVRNVRRVLCAENPAWCTVHQELHQGCALPTGDRAQCVGTVCCAPGARRAVHTPCTGCEVLGTLGFGDKM